MDNKSNIKQIAVGDDLMTEYGEMIRSFRQAAGLTQKDLGLAMGYNESTADVSIRHIESGRNYPPIDRLRKMSAALGVPLENLIP